MTDERDIGHIIHKIGRRSHNGADLDKLVADIPALLTENASLRKQIEDAREALGFAVDRMQWLEDWRNGEKTNIPSCEAALIVANKALKGKS